MREVIVEMYEAASSASNAHGTGLVTLEKHMRDYDALPPAVRKVVSTLSYDYAVKPYRRFFDKRHNVSDAYLEAYGAALRELDNQQAGVEAYAMYGPDHPQANIGRKRKIKVHPNSLLATENPHG
ncbi:MAG: hypothetical protein JWL86_2400 [Rhizobium sp.]|nr:hypothetical protein [Rhizobium sp.]